jgi:hypothetical protein
MYQLLIIRSTSVEVSNVESTGTQAKGVSDADLPFDASGLTALDNTPSDNNTLVFTYNANGSVTVTLKGSSSPSNG